AADFEGQDVIRVIEEGKKVKNAKPVLPEDYALSQNAPNPFNPATTIEYALPEETHVRLVIYNTMGQSVCTLLDALQPVGYHQFLWDGRNSQGRLVSGGVYFYRLTAGEFTETKRMLLLK
ncbi:MAG: T9SS type A sorting domain-containing protein, partial [Candidatus Latescibacteria bacterium]|nr:T9SS type A sorting domain-containing protein [Candidatus Latescibacterota bacterium]